MRQPWINKVFFFFFFFFSGAARFQKVPSEQ